MHGRFTERAQKVLVFAREEAKSVNYPHIGTEHLLLGLIREGESIAAKVLSALGIDAKRCPRPYRKWWKRVVSRRQLNQPLQPGLKKYWNCP